MLRRCMRAAAVGALFVLGSCQPIYETTYTFRQPSTIQGKICVNQCEQIRQSCYTNCKLDNRFCLRESKLEAREDYDKYVERRTKKNKKIKLDLAYFQRQAARYCSSDSCDSDCDTDYRGCFKNCGGGIDSYTRCTAFCEE